jgi:hypothetical protein
MQHQQVFLNNFNTSSSELILAIPNLRAASTSTLNNLNSLSTKSILSLNNLNAISTSIFNKTNFTNLLVSNALSANSSLSFSGNTTLSNKIAINKTATN